MPTTLVPSEQFRGGLQPRATPIGGPVLLASDGRGSTDSPAVMARLVAEHLGERVEVVSVLQPLPVYAVGADGIPAVPPDFETGRRLELHAAVRARLEPVLGPRDRWSLQVRYGSPGRVIPIAARELRAGLIVVGTGGHRPLDRVFGEEVSLQVVRHASVPVLAVAPGLAAPIGRVVVGMDFSASSIRAARTALALLEPGPGTSALLSLVHVRTTPDDAQPMLASWTGTYDLAVSERFARLRELLRPTVPRGVTLETRVRTGKVVDCLTEAAAETEADLIAVGTHGPDWVERLFVGSDATRTLRHARTSVLVAPPVGAAERVRLELAVAGRVELDRPEDWAGALDALTRRNVGRRARLEVNDPALAGFVVEAEDYRFRGATYDPHDRRVEIVLGADGAPTRHLTHSISNVLSIEIVAVDERTDERLLVADERMDTVLTFLD